MGIKTDILTMGMNAWGAKSSYNESREKGRGVATSMGRAALDFAFYEVIGGPMTMAVMGAQVAGEGLKMAHQMGYKNAEVASKQYSTNFGGYGRFRDTQVGATMRSRGLQAIQQSGVQGYSTLGNEARQYFR